MVVLLESLGDTGLLQSHNPSTEPPVIVSADWNKLLCFELLSELFEARVQNVCDEEVGLLVGDVHELFITCDH